MSYESPWRDCVKYVYIIESLYSLKAISISIRLEEGNITIFEFWLAVVNITLLLCSEENALLSLHPTTNPGTVSAAMNGTLRRAGNIQKATARCVRPLCALLRSVHERCVYNGAPSLRRIKHYQSITFPFCNSKMETHKLRRPRKEIRMNWVERRKLSSDPYIVDTLKHSGIACYVSHADILSCHYLAPMSQVSNQAFMQYIACIGY